MAYTDLTVSVAHLLGEPYQHTIYMYLYAMTQRRWRSRLSG